MKQPVEFFNELLTTTEGRSMALRISLGNGQSLRLPLTVLVISGCILGVLAQPLAVCASELETARARLLQIQQELSAAVAAEQSAYQQRDAFLKTHFDQLHENAKASQADAAPEEEVKVNPRWKELDDQVRALQSQRHALLERLTPEHPQVVNLDDQLVQATAARDAVAQILVPEPTAVFDKQSPAPTTAVVPAVDDVVARFEQLEVQCRTAAQLVDRLDLHQIEAAALVERLELSERRRSAVPGTSHSSSSATLVWGAVIVIPAVFFFILSRIVIHRRSTLSPKAVAAILGVPLLGVVHARRPVAAQ